MKRIGYVRTSTNKQYTDRQVHELKAQCDRVLIERGVSARNKNRPVLTKAISELQSGDALVVIAYDRAFRDVAEGLSFLDALTDKGIKFESLTQRFDPTTPDGRLFFTMTIAVGEWEVNTLAQRTASGLKAAVKRGKKLGRPKKGEARKKLGEKTRIKAVPKSRTNIHH